MLQNKRILIVDDEPYNIVGMKVLLPQASDLSILDYVDEAKNGKEALDKIVKSYRMGQHCYGLIFMDCNMPIMDGFEATDMIRNFIAGTDIP
jgi:CheY-like chemotaxis protein